MGFDILAGVRHTIGKVFQDQLYTLTVFEVELVLVIRLHKILSLYPQPTTYLVKLPLGSN